MSSRYSIGFLTIVLVVLLRLAIGWHFFNEGLGKFKRGGAIDFPTPTFSSEGFLRQAKGPLAETFHSFLPEYHGWDTLEATRADADEPYYDTWADRVAEAWGAMRERIAAHYEFTAEQREMADTLLEHHVQQLRDYISENKEALETHLHELDRLAATQEDPGAEAIPFKKDRVEKKIRELKAASGEWIGWARAQEAQLERELLSLATVEQRDASGPVPAAENGSLRRVDTVVAYVVLGVGVCLLLGLFTPVALVVGALFLLSVIATQPPWVADTQPIYYQLVEMLAMLTLATLPAGRWGGLDYFIYHLFRRSAVNAKA